MAAQNFKLFLGCLGNGVTVCNSAVMENGDFKMVAHISDEGKITWYVGEDYPPADALARIRACAEQERVKHEAWLNGLSPAARREYQLERLPLFTTLVCGKCRVLRWCLERVTRLSRSFLRRSACAVQSSFAKMGRCPQNGKKENEPPARRRHPAPCRCR